jgi:hypothetical protein
MRQGYSSQPGVIPANQHNRLRRLPQLWYMGRKAPALSFAASGQRTGPGLSFYQPFRC